MSMQRYELTIEGDDSAYLELDPNGPWCLADDAEDAIAVAALEPLALDVERLQKAWREHRRKAPGSACSLETCATYIADEYNRL